VHEDFPRVRKQVAIGVREPRIRPPGPLLRVGHVVSVRIIRRTVHPASLTDERIKAMRCLPAVGHAVAVGVLVDRVCAALIFLKVGQSVAVRICSRFQHAGDFLRGQRGNVQAHVGDVAVPKPSAILEGRADPERIGRVGQPLNVGSRAVKDAVNEEACIGAVENAANVRPCAGRANARPDALRSPVARVERESILLVMKEREPVRPPVVIGGLRHNRGRRRIRFRPDPRRHREPRGQREIRDSRHAHIAAVVTGRQSIRAETQGASGRRVCCPRDFAGKQDLSAMPMSAQVRGVRPAALSELPPSREAHMQTGTGVKAVLDLPPVKHPVSVGVGIKRIGAGQELLQVG